MHDIARLAAVKLLPPDLLYEVTRGLGVSDGFSCVLLDSTAMFLDERAQTAGTVICAVAVTRKLETHGFGYPSTPAFQLSGLLHPQLHDPGRFGVPCQALSAWASQDNQSLDVVARTVRPR